MRPVMPLVTLVLPLWGAAPAAAQVPAVAVDTGTVTLAGDVLQVQTRFSNTGSGPALHVTITAVVPVAPVSYVGPPLPDNLGPGPPLLTLTEVLRLNIDGLTAGADVPFDVQGTFQDLALRTFPFSASLLVRVPVDGGEVQRQAVWRGFKNAIAAGDTAGALAFIDPDARASVASFANALTPAQRAAIDTILPDIRLVEVYPNGRTAIYEAVRMTAGVLQSYQVSFVKDLGGSWVLQGF